MAISVLSALMYFLISGEQIQELHMADVVMHLFCFFL